MRRSRQRSGPRMPRTDGPACRGPLKTRSPQPWRPGSEPPSRLPRCPQADIVASKIEAHKTIVQFTLVQVGGLFAVSQACLLSVFVPQVCPPSGPSYNTTSPWCGGPPASGRTSDGQPRTAAPRVGHVVPPGRPFCPAASLSLLSASPQVALGPECIFRRRAGSLTPWISRTSISAS